MFGYVTPDKGEMKVREYECYRAVYCGLCMQLKADYGFVSRMLLNYDLVTVALLADGISGEKGSPCMKRCMANPLRRRCMHAGTQGLRLAAASLVLLSWYKLQLAKAGVPVRYGREANHDNVAAWKPDRIIWAAGGAPIMPKSIPGLDGYSVYSATDALRNLVDVGERIVMVGGGMVGCECVEFLTEREHIVDMVEMKPVIGEDIVPEARKYIMANLEKHKVTQRVNARVKQFYADGVDFTDTVTGEDAAMRGYDSVVLAMGYRSNNTLEEQLKDLAPQVIVIGEARQAPGNSMEATGDALNAALAI